VILDTYLPDRKVWQCPNARLQGVASFINGGQDWLAHLREHEGKWGFHTDPWMCPIPSWPRGWGGEVSDSLTQKRLAVPASFGRPGARAVHGSENKLPTAGVFVQSIGVNEGSLSSIAEVQDPSCYVICGDAGATVDAFLTGTLAYPDLCHLECAGPGDWEADWENCPWSRECGGTVALKLEPELRRRFARHFGGVNVGFLDGHAEWIDSEEIIANAPTTSNPNRGRLRGLVPGTTTSDAWDSTSGIPPLY
jgi:prepilin-type processing-associated H-X9-DG protein